MPSTSEPRPSLPRLWLAVLRDLAPRARPHRAWLLSGGAAALIVVAVRLALPWPLRAIMHPWLPGHAGRGAGWIALVPPGVDPNLAMGALFLLLMVGLGLADHLERLYFARFAIGSVRDVRLAALRAATRLNPWERTLGSGDLIARLIGDTARIKEALKGFLIHVATNGVLFAGVTAVLMWMDLLVGSTFAVAGLLVAAITLHGHARLSRVALKYRRKEGRLADAIDQMWRQERATESFGKVDRSSGRAEASLTRIQGLTTWSTHAILGVAVIAALLIGARGVSEGRLVAADLVVIAMYALMIRAPLVQLARQGARSGKILAGCLRLQGILASTPAPPEGSVTAPPDSGPPLAPLRDRLELAGVCVAGRRKVNRRRLGPIDLTVRAGERLAVLGSPGSGKTALLDVIAGIDRPKKGSFLWDGVNLVEEPAKRAENVVAHLRQDPAWPRRSVREILSLPEGAEESQSVLEGLRAYGVPEIVRKLHDGADARVGSAELSFGQRRALAIAGLMRARASVWLFDDPAAALDGRRARKLIARLLETTAGSTVIVAFSRPVQLERFDRVIKLRKGRVVFDGPPAAWLSRRERKSSGDDRPVENRMQAES